MALPINDTAYILTIATTAVTYSSSDAMRIRQSLVVGNPHKYSPAR